MPLNSNTGDVITVSEAKNLTQDFRTKYPNEIKGAFVGIDKLNLILSQKNCMGLRVYNAVDSVTGLMTYVLVGVDTNSKDMTAGVILDRMSPCPSMCDPATALY